MAIGAKPLIALAYLAFLSGCAASVSERHHFATIDPKTNEIVNIFRVSVKGEATAANARYIAGYYDERAVDLFFNESKASNLGPIFGRLVCDQSKKDDCKTKADEAYKVIPVGKPTDDHGAFVMILSTDATAIADTIGGLAENEAILNSALFLATQSDRKAAQALAGSQPITLNLRNATVQELQGLFNASAETPGGQPAQKLNLAILQSIAAGLSPDTAPLFNDEKDARAWFAARPRSTPK